MGKAKPAAPHTVPTHNPSPTVVAHNAPVKNPPKPTAHKKEEASWWEKAIDVGTDFIPFVGSAKDIYKGVRDGDWVEVGVGIIGFGVDLATAGGGSLVKGGAKALFKQGAKQVAKEEAEQVVKKVAKKELATVAGGVLKKEVVALDNNVLKDYLERGFKDEVEKAIGNRIPIVSRQVVREFLVKGDKQLLREFLVQRGGRVAKSGTEAEVKALMDFAKAHGRSLKIGDARVAASAIAEKVELITRDEKFWKFLRFYGHPVKVTF